MLYSDTSVWLKIVKKSIYLKAIEVMTSNSFVIFVIVTVVSYYICLKKCRLQLGQLAVQILFG